VGADGELGKVAGVGIRRVEQAPQLVRRAATTYRRHLAFDDGQLDGSVEQADVVHRVLDDQQPVRTVLDGCDRGLPRTGPAEAPRAGTARQGFGLTTLDTDGQVGAGPGS